jgi:hypothetical protein
MARPSKLTPELTRAICADLEGGLPREDACARNGIGTSTFHVWWHKNAEFREAIKAAEANCKAILVQMIRSAGADSWQALAWLAERRWPMQFSLTHRRFEAEVRADFERRIAALPIELQEAIADALESSGGDGEPGPRLSAPQATSDEEH